ncbi:MAG: hypothetical protein COW18_09275 [Zetaproteobacteria bacterium CG12_big_fil_rev_8_21_14_0_65_54_13]|nr:MAG: hypothetical protein COX55_01515 [Zetaproteobacteria bacterium CG23_combo_of_CG06-09_8_20_14_all_54_7]PIW47281.1 MAG: hypothetical protein COW18_09275 [Zetaproteobacteria bacterium CG12_big_fil_rev_8_21_14_0_65_54_13]PIX54272.1 MAG: hypothetical protein COZ50_08825 [Zetaproteobacteria bacterium CG_4_10_14_3_um_filter_54_28]PJA30417.1 MAG: hypothetical protein CO188_03585 [Zetaproteobacteria bacterium CG_4_9_14_3_um_filter_54_145]
MRFVRFNLLILLGLLAALPSQSAAAELRNVNFAVFQKVDSNFEFEAIVLGKFSNFITAMEGAQVLLLSHTRNSVDGDVINIQQDVLRDSSEGLNDIGINCSLSFRDHSTDVDTIFELGGMCKILDSLNTNVTAIIPMASLPDTEQGIDAWVELYEDEASGTAFYANVSSGD